MRKALFAVLMMFVIGCDDTLERETVRVAAHNTTRDPAILFIDGKEIGVIGPNDAEHFRVSILVPSDDNLTGPSQNVVSVPVSFKNVRTGELTEPVYCTAGVQIQINAVYQSYDDEYYDYKEYARCN
ncbi:MAG: hypothetical protein AB200_02225 [Parcubacteria bacterium C7867-005]|nr:MAG: hypothetical protein AB200_02225 [Parcubacteria bacterium C7867-005]